MLKGYLTEKKVPFSEKIIDQDPASQEEMSKISDGHMGTPFSVIKKDDGVEVKVTGFDKGKFDEALGLQ